MHLANEAELYFERGGPIQRFAHRTAMRLGIADTARWRILAFLILTWCPLFGFALLEGRAMGDTARDSLLLDFATYARFFLAVPLLIVAEQVVGPQLRRAGLQFVQGGYVRTADLPAFEQAIARGARRRESPWADILLVAIAFAGSWGFTAETIYGEGLATWRSTTQPASSGTVPSLTGLWYHFVSLPILQYFWYRWLWRLTVWISFLWSVSRLKLNLVGTHADQAGGLGFLGTAHTSLGIFAFGLSAVLSAEAAFLMVFQAAEIDSFKIPLAVLLAAVELAFLGPLLMFAPALLQTRLDWLQKYSLLVAEYNRAFHEKWVASRTTESGSLLGSSDIQSLADLGNSFEFVRAMKVFPFGLRAIIQLAIVTSLPCLPLILLVVPINQILELLARAVF
jgi:hypothetical protein